MDFLTNIVSSINFVVVAQLTFVALIMISGPVVIFLMVANRADL